MSMSLPGFTSASNNEKRAYVMPAGTVTGIRTAFGEVRQHAPFVGTSATVPGVTLAGTRPRGVAENAPLYPKVTLYVELACSGAASATGRTTIGTRTVW